jgi:hypothetical protein
MSKRRTHRVGATLAAALSLGLASLAVAQEQPESPRERPDTPAWNANVGFIRSTGIALLIPSEGSVGGGLELSARYGIPAGPFIVAPGARAGGYYMQERFIGVMMGTGRLTVPLGPVAPFVQGGAGIGGLTNPGDGGLAWLFGGGLMIHFGGALALGAEVNYTGITGTGLEVLSIGPVIVIGG